MRDRAGTDPRHRNYRWLEAAHRQPCVGITSVTVNDLQVTLLAGMLPQFPPYLLGGIVPWRKSLRQNLSGFHLPEADDVPVVSGFVRVSPMSRHKKSQGGWKGEKPRAQRARQLLAA